MLANGAGHSIWSRGISGVSSTGRVDRRTSRPAFVTRAFLLAPAVAARSSSQQRGQWHRQQENRHHRRGGVRHEPVQRAVARTGHVARDGSECHAARERPRRPRARAAYGGVHDECTDEEQRTGAEHHRSPDTGQAVRDSLSGDEPLPGRDPEDAAGHGERDGRERQTCTEPRCGLASWDCGRERRAECGDGEEHETRERGEIRQARDSETTGSKAGHLVPRHARQRRFDDRVVGLGVGLAVVSDLALVGLLGVLAQDVVGEGVEVDAVETAGVGEPVMDVEVVTPEEFFGDVMGNISSKRGQVRESGDRGNAKVVAAFVPLAEMFGYATELRSMTQGRAAYSMEFDHYDKVPKSVAEEIITKKS